MDDLSDSLLLDKKTAIFFKLRSSQPIKLRQTDRHVECEFGPVYPVVSIELYGIEKGHSVGNNSFL